ncbi:IS3 family transposase [Nocardia salmonicida]
MIIGFIDEYRRAYGVESICGALSAHGIQFAPRIYRKARRRPPSARDIIDAYVENALRDLVGGPEQMYGRRKMTRYLRRCGHRVAFCTVDRIMRDLGMNGAVRGRRHRTTIADKDGIRAGDKLNRDFTATASNLVWVADFTYVSTWTGWAYVAFVFDAYSRAIVGWTTAATKTTALVFKALNMALWRRDHYGHPIEPGLIHHSDAGSQSRLNRWMQHPRTRRVYGKAIGLDAGGHWTSAPMRSPGSPGLPRAVERLFWDKIAEGMLPGEAGVAVGVSPVKGSRWFRDAGGMSPYSWPQPGGRYLSLAEREEIALPGLG